MKKKYKVIWEELHTITIEAESTKNAFEKAMALPDIVTFVRIIGEEKINEIK